MLKKYPFLGIEKTLNFKPNNRYSFHLRMNVYRESLFLKIVAYLLHKVQQVNLYSKFNT